MKRLLYFFGMAIALFVVGCDGGTTAPTGEHTVDSSATTHSGQPEGARAWDANSNLINPNGLDGMGDMLDEHLMPFSPGYLKTHGVIRIEVRGYSDSENPDMVEGAPEQDMVLSRRRLFAFDDQGQYKDVLDERFLGDPTPATSTHLAWEFSGSNQLTAIKIDNRVGTSSRSQKRSYSFDAKGRISYMGMNEAGGTYYMYDESRSISYITQADPAGASSVMVTGGKGSLGSELCNELQEEILSGKSAFVHYPSKGRVPESINFQERDGRETVREVHMGKKLGKVEYEVVRKYNADHNLVERKKQWDVPNADFKTFDQYRYAPNGDLIQVIQQQQAFNGPVKNQIDRYIYDATGLLTQHVRTLRSGQDAEELVLIEYFVMTTASGAPQPATGQPSGTSH